jgi:hypothetical protein
MSVKQTSSALPNASIYSAGSTLSQNKLSSPPVNKINTLISITTSPTVTPITRM